MLINKNNNFPMELDETSHTILSEGAEFDGKLIFEGKVRIDGRFKGEITTGGLLTVGPTAVVEANLEVESLVVEGKLVGDVRARGSIIMRPTAKVEGNLCAPSLEIQPGAVFDGACRMGEVQIAAEPRETGKIYNLEKAPIVKEIAIANEA